MHTQHACKHMGQNTLHTCDGDTHVLHTGYGTGVGAWVPKTDAVWKSEAAEMFRGDRIEEPIPRSRHLSSTLPATPETSSPGRTPGPPTGKSPHLQAFGKEAFLQQECPPKSPRGESAVASLGVENPKVAPEWWRRRGREAGLTPDKELPPAVKDPLVSAPALEEGERTNYQGGFPGSGCPSVHRQATGIHKPA